MKITFLGTGTSQGVPVIACTCNVCTSADSKDQRLRSSILIQDKGKTYVIDTGPDFRYQMLRAEVKQLDGVIFTHEHKDHIAGFDDIRAFNYIQKSEIEVYATARVQGAIQREFPYIFDKVKYPGVPEINLHTITTEPFSINNTTFTPIELLHYKLPVLGFRLYDFCYITDANQISQTEKVKLQGLKVLVLNALRKAIHISHFNLTQALELAHELKPEKLYLTHISHQLGLHKVIQQELPPNCELAYDGLNFEL